jgi:hypothetical protein
MYYYSIYESEELARKSGDALVEGTRKDWEIVVSDDHQVTGGMIAPSDRHLAVDSEAVYGFIVQVEGPFARVDEPDRGVARYTHGYAWIAY